MIQLKSVLNVIDNSGATLAECIKCLHNATTASLGDEIVITVRKSRPQSLTPASTATTKLRKGDVRRAVIVRVKKPVRRWDGRYVGFSDNACVLVDQKGGPLGTRVLGPIAQEVKQCAKWDKVVALAPRIL